MFLAREFLTGLRRRDDDDKDDTCPSCLWKDTNGPGEGISMHFTLLTTKHICLCPCSSRYFVQLHDVLYLHRVIFLQQLIVMNLVLKELQQNSKDLSRAMFTFSKENCSGSERQAPFWTPYQKNRLELSAMYLFFRSRNL
jgi:hypothetical protein